MSADFTLVVYGVRYEVREDELDAVEARTDPRQVLARRYRLGSWWGDFATPDGESIFYLFIGEKLGYVGYEGSFEIALEAGRIAELAADVDSRLRQAGFQETSRLYVQFGPDS